MADNTEVNSQITDAVTQTNVKVLGEAPAQAMGTLYQIASQAAGIAINNANTNQQNLNQLNPAIVSVVRFRPQALFSFKTIFWRGLSCSAQSAQTCCVTEHNVGPSLRDIPVRGKIN